MKFNMGAQTLSTLTKDTSGAHDDLGSLVKQLVVVAEPLMTTMGGNAAVAFFNFKDHVDEVARDLNSSLASILTGQGGMDTAFTQGDQDMASNATAQQGSANFDAARFGARR